MREPIKVLAMAETTSDAALLHMSSSRRLTGPNLLLDGPGAVLDVGGPRPALDRAIEAWALHARALLGSVGWGGEGAVWRSADVAALAVPAPLDRLYAAADLNEAAWEAALASLDGIEMDLAPVLTRLIAAADEEAEPALLDLAAEANRRGRSFLWDEDMATVGLGAGARSWPRAALPEAAGVEWANVHDVPVALVTGTNGKSTTVRMLAAVLGAAGFTTSSTTTDYVRVGDDVLETGDCSGPASARLALRDERTEAAVLEVARGGLLRRGLPVGRAAAVAVTNVAADHLGEYGVETVEDVAAAKFVVAKALHAGGTLVTTADEPLCLAWGERLAPGLAARGARLCWTAPDAAHPVVVAHVAAGGAAASVVGGALAFADGGAPQAGAPMWQPVLVVSDLPAALGGAAVHNVRNALTALALARALGVGAEAVAAGLAAFGRDAADNPGRADLYALGGGGRALADYAHNTHGLAALFQTAAAYPAARRLLLLSQPGDRRDDDLRAFAHRAAEAAADRYVIADLPDYLRGRVAGAIPALLRQALLDAGVPAERIELADDPAEGVRRALAWAGPGDFLLLSVLSHRTEALALLRAASDGTADE